MNTIFTGQCQHFDPPNAAFAVLNTGYALHASFAQPNTIAWSVTGDGEAVTPVGLEPTTVCLEGRCSIHLSYGIKATKVTRKMANPKGDHQYPVGAARSTDDLPAPERDAIPASFQNVKKVSTR